MGPNRHASVVPSAPIQIRPLRPDEADEACALARSVFDHCLAPIHGDQGRDLFHRFAQPAALLRRHARRYTSWVAVAGPEPVGLLHIHACNHISMLFVSPDKHGRGCGAGLIRAASEAGALRPPLTVNSSPNAVGFYAKLAFVPAGPEHAANGVRIQPMRRPGPFY